MKALSVHQPCATLIVAGAKRLETRSWQTAYRGPLAIHAAGKLTASARALCAQSPFRELLTAAGITHPDQLPLGAIVGTVVLRDCVHVEAIDLRHVSSVQRALGDFGPGRWIWVLEQPARLGKPIGRAGKRGLFDIPELLQSLEASSCLSATASSAMRASAPATSCRTS